MNDLLMRIRTHVPACSVCRSFAKPGVSCTKARHLIRRAETYGCGDSARRELEAGQVVAMLRRMPRIKGNDVRVVIYGVEIGSTIWSI